MKWKPAVIEALKRYCRRHGGRAVVLQALVDEEIDRIRRDTASRGKTPEATLRRELQELRALGLVEFVDDDGSYRYLGDL